MAAHGLSDLRMTFALGDYPSRMLQRESVLSWKAARERYNDLSRLTRVVNQHVTVQVFLSCLNNFFSICIQLQFTVT